MRKDVYERMRYFVLEKIRPNYSAIARQYDVDPRTVKAAYVRAQSGEVAVVRKRRKRRSKLDGYRDIIEDKYASGCSARSIYDFIVEKGFTGKYTIVKDYCRRFRRTQAKKATIRVEHTIGLSAQVDWKERVTMTDRNGVPHTFSIFLYVLPYSKFKFGTMQKITDTLNGMGIKTTLVYGATPKQDREGMINNFRTGDAQVLVSNPNTLGESISLHQTVHDAVYFEYNFNLTFMLQSRDRINRLGLPANQYTRYYYLMTKGDVAHMGFIDNTVYKKLKDKERVMLDAIDGQLLVPEYTDDYLQEVKDIVMGRYK
ncbi:helicase-related protein [Limosilactobacillus reuteri subsp. suis]|uniref:helicase-related protein n=1 Tax=Limosilactobacillus reuteri TaxID=1598 RepID=UPI003992158C